MPTWVRPATLPFRIGTDICRIDRIKRIISNGSDDKRLMAFVYRVMTPQERGYFQKRFPVQPIETLEERLPAMAVFLAGRYLSPI
jgi:phosphopantetheinyl transferase (holo-ACP synthase)